MKNKMKRVLAFVVAFAMVFTLMPGNSLVSRAEANSCTFAVDYDDANGASVSCKVGDNEPYNPTRFTEYNFLTEEGVAQTVTFTLTPPSSVPEGETAEVHVLANGQDLEVQQDNTVTFTPNASESNFIRICWTREEYNYESYGADPEVSDFMVEYNVSGCGTVSLKKNPNGTITRGSSTKAIYNVDTDSVEFLLTPEEGKDFAELIVGQQPFSKQDLINGLFSDGTLVQTGEVLVFTLNTSAYEDNAWEWMEFRFTDDNPPAPAQGGATHRDTYDTYEYQETSTLTVTGTAEGYINGSWFSSIEAPIENQNIEYPVPFDPGTIQPSNDNKVEFEFVTLINERYTSIKINGVDYTNQIPGMQAELTEDDITQAVLDAIALNGSNQDTSFIIEVPYADSYTVVATKEEIGSENAAYWPVGNFLWSGVDMGGNEPEGPSFISVENEQYGGTVDYVIGELGGKYSYFAPSDVSEGTVVKLIVCDTNGAPTAKITGGDKDGTSLVFTAGQGANTYETEFTYTSDMTGVVVTLAEGTEEVQTYRDSVEGGSFELLKFTYKGTTYTRAENQSWGDVFREKNLPCYFDWTQIFDGEGNLLNGSAVFPAGAELTIQLLPDYGHQLTAFGFNGRSLTAGEDPATYTVTVPNGNFHINCLFEKVEPTTKVDSTNTVVTEADLSVRETDAPVESGTLNMTVKDAELNTSKYPDALAAVDINLENVFYDVNTRGVNDDWTKGVTELNNQVEVTLKVEGLDTNKAYQVIREHYVQNGNGEPVLNTDTLEAQVNENGTITFESDRFSTYVIKEVPDIVCNQSKDVTLRFWKFDEEQRAYVPAYDSIGYFYINNGSAEDGGNPYDIPGSRLRLHNGVIKKAGRETGTNELLFQGEIGFAISGAYLLSDKAEFNEAGILTDPDFASSTKLSTTTKDVISNSGNKTENNIYSASLAVTENESETYDILIETKSRHTIVWENHETKNFGSDALIENGAATLVSVTDAEGHNLLETGEANYSGDGDSGYCMIPDGAYVTVKLIPDYGYQVLSASIAGDSATLTPNTDVSSFTFKMPSTNVHFRGIMQPANDKLTESADKVSAVTIADGENAAAYGGNLQLTVTDNTKYDKLSDVADIAGKSAEVKVEQVATLDLQLDNIINRAAADDYWTENVTSFENDIKVKLTLDDVTLADGEKLVVVREHDGKLEKIEAQYQDGVITVPTNKFSTYSIVKTTPVTHVTSVTINEKTVDEDGSPLPLKFTQIGETATKQLNVTVLPANADDKSVEWTSSVPAVAKVDNTGKVTAVSNGVTTITATSVDNKEIFDSVVVEVAESIENTEVSKETETGSNPGDVSVETNVSNAVKDSISIADFTTTTAKAELNKSGELSEVQNQGADAKLSLYVTSLSSTSAEETSKIETQKDSLPVDTATDFMTLDISMYKTVADEAKRLTEIENPIKVEVTVPDSAILSDTTGTITRHYYLITVHEGVTSIEELPFNASTKKLTLTMNKFSTRVLGYYDTRNVSSVTISGNTATLTAVGATTQLSATVEPADASIHDVTWSSSNPAVATVDANGKVTAVANGTTTIKATSKDNEAVYGVKEITVSIPSPCTHAETEIKNAKAATCIADGYTGDTYCKSCGTKISSGTVIKAAGHKYDAGKVTKEPTVDAEGVKTYTCTVCGATKTEPIAKIPDIKDTLSNPGIYVLEANKDHISAGLVTEGVEKKYIEYSWWATADINNPSWILISDWTLGSEWMNWTPDKYGDYYIVAKARVVGKPETEVTTCCAYEYHPQIKGICQMPYSGENGNGFLIGIESYDNPNQSYYYEMLVLDCTLLAQGLPAWTYSTGKFQVSEGNAGWTIWTPEYGYYWTLFRVYDADGNMIDEQCYGFVNAY